MEQPSGSAHMVNLDAATLRAWPLPTPSSVGERRGHVLVLGGSREMPGAVILAASAALRAGAARLTVATGASIARLVALAIPEARVLGLPETPEGGFTRDAADRLDPLADKVDTILIGPGMQDEAASAALVRALLPRLGGAALVLDAGAMASVLGPGADGSAGGFRFAQPVIVTAHAGELAHLAGAGRDAVPDTPERQAYAAAARWNAVVVLKGARSVVGAPDGALWQHEGGNAGLAACGCGDTLAGIIAGLAARGATLQQAACWGVALHARAGELLAERFGVLGYLAREIPDQIPALMEALARQM